ncbi:hypothetical protein K469DRAFT_519476, partial [Zopfia rhizophila CBS 207.26]
IGIDTTPLWVRRQLGTAFESKHLKPIFKSGREIVSVFGIMSLDFKGPLVILP